MRKLIFLLPLLLTLNLTSCSSDGEMNNEDIVDNENSEDSEDNEDSWRIINIVGKWHLDYTLETNHDGTHVGTEERIESTEYNYIDYEFKDDNTFIKTIVEGESEEDAQTTILKGEYLAHYPEEYTGKWLELEYENGDSRERRIELNDSSTRLVIDLGTTTVNCGCSENKYDYEQIFLLQ